MAFALFGNSKIVVSAELNQGSLMQTQRSNEQYKLATQTLSLQQSLTSTQAAQSLELSKLYEELAEAEEDTKRASVQADINKLEKENEHELDSINRQIYLVSNKEKGIELLVKRLDTKVTALQKRLEAVEQAEGGSIDRATPKFKGVN